MSVRINPNFEILGPTDFLAAITQHIPDKGVQMVRYYGWSSNKMRDRKGPDGLTRLAVSGKTMLPTARRWGLLRIGRRQPSFPGLPGFDLPPCGKTHADFPNPGPKTPKKLAPAHAA
jgi:hypothetical protein